MTDLRAMLESATTHISVDVEAAVLDEARRRRRRNRAVSVVGAVACVALLSAGIAQAVGALDRQRADVAPAESPTDVVRSTAPAPEGSAPATQPVWDPSSVGDAPMSDIGLTDLLPAGGGLQPDIEPDANPVATDPATGVVVAWSEKGAGVRLLGTDGRWRSAPADFETNEGTPYAPDAPSISADGTRIAAATESGLRVLDVTTGEVTVLPWPGELAPPWDWAPGLRWLPGDDALLVLDSEQPWVIELDGGARRSDYDIEQGVTDVFGIDPEGAIYQNDYPRNTLVTWQDDRPVNEVPFPQCQRLVAASGLVACTTGSLDHSSRRDGGAPRSGPVVVDAATGEILGYAPIEDPDSAYSDNGGLTAVGFLDTETVVLMVEPRRQTESTASQDWHLIAWNFADGSFERIATGVRQQDSRFSVAPALMD